MTELSFNIQDCAFWQGTKQLPPNRNSRTLAMFFGQQWMSWPLHIILVFFLFCKVLSLLAVWPAFSLKKMKCNQCLIPLWLLGTQLPFIWTYTWWYICFYSRFFLLSALIWETLKGNFLMWMAEWGHLDSDQVVESEGNLDKTSVLPWLPRRCSG